MSIMNIMDSMQAGCVADCSQKPCGPTSDQSFDQSLLTSAATKDDVQTFAELARLSPANYDRIRKREAKRLGIRVETLDTEVACVRAEAREEEMFQSALS